MAEGSKGGGELFSCYDSPGCFTAIIAVVGIIELIIKLTR